MKIGVWLGFGLKESTGGAFSYTDRLIKLIDEYQFPEDIDVCFVNLAGTGSFHKDVCSLINLPSIVVKLLKALPFLFKVIREMAKPYIKRKGLNKVMERHGIKLMYYLHQSECLDSNFPFIATNWDIGHRSTHAFPEVMWDGKSYEERENYYRIILPKALMIFCESQTGKKEIINYTNIGEHKIRVFPMFGGSVTTVKLPDDENQKILREYGLTPNRFFFYPAQFWAHKNHVGLIKAFSNVLKKYPDLKLVLSGSDKGNKEYVRSIISELNISNKVIFLGFVPIETLYCMYKNAAALVMASHFGPTNMPPIEAMEIGCPVACSDLGGHHEILGDAAVYFDSYSIESITCAMLEIFEENDEYKRKIFVQKEITDYSDKKSMDILANLLREVAEIRLNWK